MCLLCYNTYKSTSCTSTQTNGCFWHTLKHTQTHNTLLKPHPATGGHWQKGSLVGKPATIFTSTATQGSGMETTIMTAVTQLAHHGMIFVPPGYSFGAKMFQLGACWGESGGAVGCDQGKAARVYTRRSVCTKQPETNRHHTNNHSTETPKGGSPWGAGTLAGPDGSRQPTEDELAYARHQGTLIAQVTKKLAA